MNYEMVQEIAESLIQVQRHCSELHDAAFSKAGHHGLGTGKWQPWPGAVFGRNAKPNSF